jgi:hypothetical protein
MIKDNISKHYTADFYEIQKTGSYHSAIKFLQHLFKHYMPRSIVDFGAGVGTWLAAAKELGITDVLAIDGNWVKDLERVDSSIPYIFLDLEERIYLEKCFDLAISLEVAEHLTPSRAATFIDDICKASDLVIFSAAMKDQGGSNHINEQDPSYWIELFRLRAYECIDFFRAPFWRDNTIEPWYIQNTFLFIRMGDPRRVLLPNYPLWDVIHPRLLFNPVQFAKFGVNVKITRDIVDL